MSDSTIRALDLIDAARTRVESLDALLAAPYDDSGMSAESWTFDAADQKFTALLGSCFPVERFDDLAYILVKVFDALAGDE